MAEGLESPTTCMEATRLDERPEHGMKIVQGLNKLRNDKVLCDVTLIAEDRKFEVHRVILVSCSDYFRSMFTSGMRESTQREIELKGITSKGLEKVIEVVYTSTTTLDTDDIFDVIAAATHLQVTPVIEFCERNFLSGMTTMNFYDFISTAKLYNMNNALKQIDAFIARNLRHISQDGTLSLLTYDQVYNCLTSEVLYLREIDIFRITWEWLKTDSLRDEHAVELMRLIRFPLISPADLVQFVQNVEMMMTNNELREMVLAALNYHVIPHAQTLVDSGHYEMRTSFERLVSVGGREIHPNPCLHDEILIFESQITANSLLNRQQIASLPSALSHMQVVVFNGFLYVLGGCTTQCAHGESAVNSVLRYDARFDCWLQVAPMINKRAYFFAGVLNGKIYAVGGKYKDGSLATAERYDPRENRWEQVVPLPMSYHAHAGAVFAQHVYISGGYSGNHFTPDMQRHEPGSNHWEDMSPMLTPRGWHVMCATQRKLFAFGGCNLNVNQQAQPVMQSECYDPQTDQWTNIAPLSVSHKEASCVMYNDQIYVLGGYNVQTKTGQKLVSRYDLYTGIWETIGALARSLTGVGYCVLRFPSYNIDEDIETD